MSGLIYLAIIAMWAAYLFPLWRRRNESFRESERFSAAMRVLARHSRGRTAGAARPPTPGPAAPDVPVSTPGPVLPADAGRRRLLARRRRLLLLLAVTTVALAVLHAAGIVRLLTVVAAGLLLSADLVHLRLQARRDLELAQRRRLSHRAAAAPRRHARAWATRPAAPAGSPPTGRPSSASLIPGEGDRLVRRKAVND